MKNRLVAVSNRVGPIRGVPQAGGLAVSLVDALRARRGMWFGWSGHLNATPGAPQQDSHEDLLTVTIDLPASEYHGYYSGYANGCLWPLFHFRPDLVHYRAEDYQAYCAVNERFARALKPMLRPDDVIWIHDFHLIPLAEELRRLGCKQRIGFFLHIPFPPAALLINLPVYGELLRQLGHYDLIGLQTSANMDQLLDCMGLLAQASTRQKSFYLKGRKTRCGVFPVGIRPDEVAQFASDATGQKVVTRMRADLRGRQQIIGVDRLDYSKGLLRRVAAYERFLQRCPRSHGHIEYLQLAPVSRGEVVAYQSFRHELELAAARINGHYAKFDWTPLSYLNNVLARHTLAGLYRASHIGLVTPLRDGMNLVAKEFVAAQDPEDPGVLILSIFAGAAQQMEDALRVNPYDTDAVADAIEHARAMPLEERRGRHARLMKGLREWDARRWQGDFLDALQEIAA